MMVSLPSSFHKPKLSFKPTVTSITFFFSRKLSDSWIRTIFKFWEFLLHGWWKILENITSENIYLSWISECSFTASYSWLFFPLYKFFKRKYFTNCELFATFFFFLLLQAKDERNSSHFPNHDSLIMHILVMLESDQKKYYPCIIRRNLWFIV